MIVTRGLGDNSLIITRGFGASVIAVAGEAIKIFYRASVQSIAKIAPSRVFNKARPVKNE